MIVASASWRAALPLAALLLSTSVHAGEQQLLLQPATTQVKFTLGATLHTVEGTIRLDHARLRFDPDSGAASGELVLDAKSAQTGNERRDANMQRDVLESGRFPYVTFRPEKLEVVRREEQSAEIRLAGSLELHGETRPFAIPAKLARTGDGVSISAAFRIPYVDWNVHDPSNFVLRVDRFVDVTVEARGKLTAR